MNKVGFNKTTRFFISYGVLFFLIASPLNTGANILNQFNTQKVSQSYVEFMGVVVDAITKEPLIFADVTVNGSNIRTVTNKEGEFLLKVPNDLLDKDINISFLGYEKLVIPLGHLPRPHPPHGHPPGSRLLPLRQRPHRSDQPVRGPAGLDHQARQGRLRRARGAASGQCSRPGAQGAVAGREPGRDLEALHPLRIARH